MLQPLRLLHVVLCSVDSESSTGTKTWWTVWPALTHPYIITEIHTQVNIYLRERNTQNNCTISIITEYKYSARYTEEPASVYTPQAQCNLRITTKQAAPWIMQRPSGTSKYQDVLSVRLSTEPDKSWCTLLHIEHIQKLYQAHICPFLRGYQDTADCKSIHTPLSVLLLIQIKIMNPHKIL